MSQRQSCDRCRQQKVRCLRDDTATGDHNPTSSGRNSFSRCERCTKAGVDCVYSLTSNGARQRSNRRSSQAYARGGPNTGPTHPDTSSWFDSGITGAFFTGGTALHAGTELPDLVGQFSNLDENGTIGGFNCWDANLQPFSPTSLASIAATSAADAPPTFTAPSMTHDRGDSSDIDEEKDTSDALSSQLASLSQRATRATRRLVRPGRASLTVSSSEVNEALENTNALIRIMQKITAPDREQVELDSTTTNCGLAFSALACHQHLVALFRAICDTIHGCIQPRKEQPQRYNQGRHKSDVEPSSVAQFVMVLQLLMHLINRMDRSLFQNNPTTWHAANISTGNTTPNSPLITNSNSIESLQLEEATSGSTSRGGLLFLVHDIVGTIPSEQEKLRTVIQQLQTEMEHPELS